MMMRGMNHGEARRYFAAFDCCVSTLGAVGGLCCDSIGSWSVMEH